MGFYLILENHGQNNYIQKRFGQVKKMSTNTILKSILCNHIDVYILIKGVASVAVANI